MTYFVMVGHQHVPASANPVLNVIEHAVFELSLRTLF